MKTLLICPGERDAVAALAETAPLSNVLILGKPLVEYWLEHLAEQGARHIYILATDRPEQVRELVGNGARWGLIVEVLPEVHEPTLDEARTRYQSDGDDGWLAAPQDVQLMDRLPRLPRHSLFSSYADWYAALQAWMPHAATPERIGVHTLKPGVWIGLHSHIEPGAELHGPLWIGDNVHIAAGAVVGPWTILENGAYVEEGAEISGSVIGSETLVGRYTEVRRSIAWGATLVNWKLNSWIKVPDPFLLCRLGKTRTPFQNAGLLGRLAAAWALTLTLPLALYAITVAKLRGRRAFRPQLAVRPQPAGSIPTTGDTLIYYQLAGGPGWLQRWPQLFEILRGDFAWIGNRPLSPREAARLHNDFERLWLAAPLGLISLADTETGHRFFDDEARAHASFYAARASWRLDLQVFLRAVFLFVFGVPYSRAREHFGRMLQPIHGHRREAH